MRLSLSLPIIFFISLSPTFVEASVIAPETIDAMARRVPVIVRGRVTRNVSGWDEPKHRIWTWTEIVVSDVIKGRPPQVVLVKQPGGEVGNIGQAVSGAASFREGEECVLFLEAAAGEVGTFRTVGLSAGKVSLTQWRGKKTASRDLRGITFASPGGSRVAPVHSPEFLGSSEQFVARIRNAAGVAK